MQKIFVLADDLTGAAEIGGVAIECGLSVRIVFNLDSKIVCPEDVLVLDTNSRSKDPNQAYDLIYRLLAKHNYSKYGFIYKKVDSLLRGPVISEIRACLKIFDLEESVIVPANPSKGRLIQNGNYYIDGVPLSKTEFSQDPLHPGKTNCVKELISESRYKDEKGRQAIMKDAGNIIIPNISTVHDIRNLASQMPEAGVLPAGAVDFFLALLEIRMKLKRIDHKTFTFNKISGGKCYIIGSRSVNSRESISRLKKQNYKCFRLPENAIKNEIVFRNWLSDIEQSVLQDMNIVISGPVHLIKDKPAVRRITEQIVFAAKRIVELYKFRGHFFIEGGETASGFFRIMEWNSIIVLKVHSDGVVTLRPEKGGTIVTIKPGSYEWPEDLFV
jgi:D-threonate/D-erythronate kinase